MLFKASWVLAVALVCLFMVQDAHAAITMRLKEIRRVRVFGNGNRISASSGERLVFNCPDGHLEATLEKVNQDCTEGKLKFKYDGMSTNVCVGLNDEEKIITDGPKLAVKNVPEDSNGGNEELRAQNSAGEELRHKKDLLYRYSVECAANNSTDTTFLVM